MPKFFPSCQTDELNCGKVDNPDVVEGAKQSLFHLCNKE